MASAPSAPLVPPPMDLCPQLSTILQKAVTLTSGKGASRWLSALPLQECSFTLHKTKFHNALALRYGWLPSRMPSHCTCGSNFQLNMLYLEEGFHPSGTMRYMI